MNDLYLSKELYPRLAIIESIQAFKNIAMVDINEDETHFVCRFTVFNNYPLQSTIMEFENYVIDYINSEKLYERT